VQIVARHAANAVTGLRIVLTPVFLWSVRHAQDGGASALAPLVFAAVALSDFLDGRVARRLGAANGGGRVLDHGADIVFILAALTLYVRLGAVPWWVPASIAASFAVYVIDSLLRSGRRPALIGSRIGHLGGVCNYALIGVLVGNDTAGLGWLPTWLMDGLFALVPLYSAAAIAMRMTPLGVLSRQRANPQTG
jgi:phosphatidylglycerophosphate synthase